MKSLTTTALAALFAGTAGALALMPAAFAEDATTAAVAAAPTQPAPPLDASRDDMRPGNGMRGMMQRGPGAFGGPRADVFDLACGPRGAEALEIALVHLQYAVQPTAAQQPLLDTLKTTALADQKTFAEACKTALGDAKPDDAKTDLLARLQARLAVDTAKVAALSDVLPKFKAFYDSLTPEQKAKLTPPRMEAHFGFNGPMGQMGPRGMHLHQRHMGPGMGKAPDAAPAPGDTTATPPAPADDSSPT
jgi:hypothetical protein